MDKFFLEKFFTPVLYIQNDQRVMGIILRYACWDTPPAGERLGGRCRPPATSKTAAHPSGSHIGWRQPPCSRPTPPPPCVLRSKGPLGYKKPGMTGGETRAWESIQHRLCPALGTPRKYRVLGGNQRK